MSGKGWLTAVLIVSCLIGCTGPVGPDGRSSSYAPFSYDWRKYNLRGG